MNKLLASTDALATDTVMAWMMGVDPGQLPVQKQAQTRGLGTLEKTDIDIHGQLVPIPDFKMPVTFTHSYDQETKAEIRKLYPAGIMRTRITVKPLYLEDRCTKCGDCVLNCPSQALTVEPEFGITDECIACYCCVELCSEGVLEVPDVEAFRYY
ncbi:4Fe-4S binding protein [Chloroflexota bacterium]